MLKFDYLLPTQLAFGRGRVSEVGQFCAAYGKKPLIVTGKSSARTDCLRRHRAA
jgi:alcohol dehydrogenase YqhD (iron-dependent ADH family)